MFSALLLAFLPLALAKSKSISIDFSSYDSTFPTVQGSDPFSRTYTASNVDISDGYLMLKVVPSAAIQTNDTNILYGTFKTTAIASNVPGVCHGFFTTAAHDQATSCNSSQNTRDAIPYPADPTTGEHEYTLEWSRKSTKYYFDGALIATMDTNVPSEPSAFLWNSWSSGNVNWTSGPPTEDSILRISKIDISYKTSAAQRTSSSALSVLALVVPLLSWAVIS
ncbi:concanavalin A-like lectin/glucanase domain-containing protein [Cerioporus squamosus]|nr:concanavalin A-like lectin/glucanase domain-containing protein [Cerioporus squamosus]